jgi:hypothetical protein
MILRGRCCAVYGLPGYGREFFAKHIVHILSKEQPEIKTLLINVELQDDPSQLVKSFLAELAGEKEFSLASFKKYTANNKVLIVLGEVLSPDHEDLFKFLNYLKWEGGDNFVVFTTANYSIMSRYGEYRKHGSDIFHPRLIIPPFDFKGTKKMIELNNDEYNWRIDEKHFKRIYELSGGNPAITKYVCMVLYEEGEELLDKPNKLIKFQPLSNRLHETYQLVFALDTEQQKKIGFLNKDNEVFAELLQYYIDNFDNKHIETFMPNLTAKERKVLGVLLEAQSKLVDKDQLALVLGQDLDTYSEWAIYKMVQRLRGKAKKNFDIETVKGKGWILRVKRPIGSLSE